MGKVIKKHFASVEVIISPQGWNAEREKNALRFADEIERAISDSKILSQHHVNRVVSYDYKCTCGEWYESEKDVENCDCDFNEGAQNE